MRSAHRNNSFWIRISKINDYTKLLWDQENLVSTLVNFQRVEKTVWKTLLCFWLLRPWHTLTIHLLPSSVIQYHCSARRNRHIMNTPLHSEYYRKRKIFEAINLRPIVLEENVAQKILANKILKFIERIR